ncbi:MAG: hypothetical protein QXL94_00520 [Candidatus Parvarchaeum sp.]
MAEDITIDVDATLKGLDTLGTGLQALNLVIYNKAVALFRYEAIRLAPLGVPGNSTSPSGLLKKSIREWHKLVLPDGIITGSVGGFTIYARQREFGGEIVAKDAPMLRFTIFDKFISKKSVHQDPTLYMTKASALTTTLLRPLVKTALTEFVAAVNKGK